MTVNIDYLANHPEHIEEVAQLRYSEWHHMAPERPYAVWVEKVAESASIDSLPVTLLALDENGLVGFVTLVHFADRSRVSDALWLIALYVKAEFRGCRIGERLVTHCKAEAHRFGAQQLYLWTETKRLTGYYQRQGWQYIHTDDNGDDILVIDIR